MYGLGQGIAQGLQMAQQGMLQAEDIKTRRREMQMRERQFSQQMQTGALAQDKTAQELEMVKLQLEQFKKERAKEDTFKALDAFERSGDAKYLNLAKENPIIADLFNRQGITSFMTPAELSEEKKQTLGLTEELLNDPSKRVVVATKPDGSLVAIDLMATYAMTGYLDRLDSKKLKEIEQRSKELKLREQEAQTKTSELKLEDMQKFLEANPEATLADYLKTQQAGRDITPFSIKSAEYFGNLKAKIDSGEASPQEEETYKAYLLEQGGTTSAKLASLSIDEQELKEKSIDLAAPNFDLDNLEGEDRKEALKVIRQLEATEGGRKLVANIASTLGKDLGAVEKTAQKLTELATQKNVSTSVVQETMDVAKAYLPTGMKEMTEEDLNNAEFRQAFLSASAVFLKMQSGLAISDKEAARFAMSFGTLNKNEKINMVGLKTKLDEVIGSYEKNAVLEPTLYNAKYKKGVDNMKEISNQIDSFISPNRKGTVQAPAATGPVQERPPIVTEEDRQILDSIFGGK